MRGAPLGEAFASTGLVALVFRALKAMRPELLPETGTTPDPMRSATLAAADKHGLLAGIHARAGAGPLLAIGQHLDLADETPTLATLSRVSEPAVFAEKWMRLERYHHAFNRTDIAVSGKGFVCVRSSIAGTPSPAENALIAGLLAGLVARAGACGVTLHFGKTILQAAELDGTAKPDIGDGKRFDVTWRSWEGPAPAEPPDVKGEQPITHLRHLLNTDIARSWRIGDTAPLLATSVRSLQRHLADQGRSFSSVLRQTRVNAAGDMLGETGRGLAEIGYCCGYADQAHFQRDFRRALNMTPSAFRNIARETVC